MQASGLNKLTSHDIIGVWHADLRCKGDNISSNSINSQAVTLSKLVAAFPWMGCCSGLPDHPGEKAISTSSGRPVEVETADGVQKVLIAPASYCYCLLISSAATFVPEIWKDSGWLSVATPFLLGPFPFFFFFEFFEGKRILLKDKNGWFHLMPRSMSAPKMPFPKTISLEPGLCSLDRNLIWKRIPDGARNEALSLNISFQPFEVGWVWTNFRATVLYFDIEKLVQTVGFQTSEVQTQVPVAFLLPSEGFLFRITAQICMICSNVGSRHPKNVAPMKDIDRFSCRTLRWNIVTHGPCVYNL